MSDRPSSFHPDAPPITGMSSDPTMMEVVRSLLLWLSVELRTNSEPAALLSAAMAESFSAIHGSWDVLFATVNLRLALALELWDRGWVDPQAVQEAFGLRPGQRAQPARSRTELRRSPIRSDREKALALATQDEVQSALAQTAVMALVLREAVSPGSPDPTPYEVIHEILKIVGGRLGVTAPDPMPVEKIISVSWHRVA